MKTGRMISFLNKYYPPVFCMLLLLCCILTGCTQEEDPYTKAVEFFKAGEYSAAEPNPCTSWIRPLRLTIVLLQL